MYANGNKYEGQWQDDKRHGSCTLSLILILSGTCVELLYSRSEVVAE